MQQRNRPSGALISPHSSFHLRPSYRWCRPRALRPGDIQYGRPDKSSTAKGPGALRKPERLDRPRPILSTGRVITLVMTEGALALARVAARRLMVEQLFTSPEVSNRPGIPPSLHSLEPKPAGCFPAHGFSIVRSRAVIDRPNSGLHGRFFSQRLRPDVAEPREALWRAWRVSPELWRAAREHLGRISGLLSLAASDRNRTTPRGRFAAPPRENTTTQLLYRDMNAVTRPGRPS